MKKLLAVLLTVCMCATLVIGCGGNDSSSKKSSSGKKDPKDMKIVLILPGSIDDQSWNASNNAGAEQANKELGTKIEVVESVPAEEFESTFTEYGEKGYDIVMAAGSQFDEACAAVAPKYPNTYYSIINGSTSNSDNMVPIFPKEYEGSYVCGVIAGYATKNGKFATMGGESNVPMVHLLDTYEAAAKETATSLGISSPEAKRAFLNTWTDVSITKSTTDQMIDNGADVVFCYSNEGTSGAIQSAADKNATFVGFAANKNTESDCVIASVNMVWANVYPWIIKGIADGSLRGYQEVGVKEGVFEIIYSDKCSDDLKKAADGAFEELKAGKDLTNLFSDK